MSASYSHLATWRGNPYSKSEPHPTNLQEGAKSLVDVDMNYTVTILYCISYSIIIY